MMTTEQHQIFEEAVMRGLAKNFRAAYEEGAAALRRQLQELKDEEKVKYEAAHRAEVEALAETQRIFIP